MTDQHTYNLSEIIITWHKPAHILTQHTHAHTSKQHIINT